MKKVVIIRRHFQARDGLGNDTKTRFFVCYNNILEGPVCEID